MDYHKIALEKISRQLETPAGFIRLSGPLEHDNIVNGDGLRAVLWTQGCPNHCKGCQNPETWDYEAGFLVEIDEIKERLKAFHGQAGLTFCGGEPFVQAKACKEIADWVRAELGWNVWSFSGFTYEIIKEYGYEVTKAVAVDQFPWTGNCEVCCLLEQLRSAKEHIEITIDAEDYYRIKESEKKSE